MKWLSQYILKDQGHKHDLYISDRTGHKVLLKKTQIQLGVTEIGVLQKLKGNAFPKLLDYRVNGDEMHIALQFIEGNTFKYLNEAEMCRFTANQLLLNALTSLDEIHGSGFIHCDIKPENMIFDTQFHVYIIDFGIAEPIQQKKARNELRGSIEFMPPESLYAPSQIDCRSDYYSLGKSLEKCLDQRMSLLSYNAVACLNSLCAIIPNDRPSNLREWIKTLKCL